MIFDKQIADVPEGFATVHKHVKFRALDVKLEEVDCLFEKRLEPLDCYFDSRTGSLMVDSSSVCAIWYEPFSSIFV